MSAPLALALALAHWQHALFFLLMVPLVTYALTSFTSALALRRNEKEQSPPIMPYWLPFFGNLPEFVRDAPAFAGKIT